MTPERAAKLVAMWVRLYTRRLPAPIAERRIGEIEADLHDHIVHERAHGAGERRIARSILSRMVRGLEADAAWRVGQAPRSAYRLGFAIAALTAFMLFWAVGAVGVIGQEGDSADRMYVAVLATVIIGAAIARFRAAGMARALQATALVQVLVTAIALATGEQRSPVTSVFEILGINAFFVALFLASAWLFSAARGSARG